MDKSLSMSSGFSIFTAYRKVKCLKNTLIYSAKTYLLRRDGLQLQLSVATLSTLHIFALLNKKYVIRHTKFYVFHQARLKKCYIFVRNRRQVMKLYSVTVYCYCSITITAKIKKKTTMLIKSFCNKKTSNNLQLRTKLSVWLLQCFIIIRKRISNVYV